MKLYHQTILEIQSLDQDVNDQIIEQYLSNFNFRMRNLIDNVRPDFWPTYAKRIVSLAKSNELLFRAKFINQERQSINVLNIWSSKEIFERLYEDCDGKHLIDSFKMKNFYVAYKYIDIPKTELSKQIEKIKNDFEHVIEFNVLDKTQQKLINS